jgi:hypothetical protein
VAQFADDAPTDVLDHGRNIGIGGRLDLDEARLEAGLGAIQIDSLKEDEVEMEVEIDGAAKALDKGDRSRLDLLPWDTACDRLAHVILADRGANNRMDHRRQVLRGGHPIPQGDGYRHDPLAGGDPGNDPLNQVRGRLGHAPPRTRRAKPPPLATEGQQQLFGAGVTAKPQKAVREDAALQVVVQFAFHIGG